MAGGTADALEEAKAEKQKIYQRMTEVRGLLDAALDSAERMRQTQRLKILRDMYRDACDRVERLRPAQAKKRKTVTQTVKTGGVTWDLFERSGVVWSDLDGNGHVYSGNYGDFVWDYLPADLQEKVPREFFINYSKEATLGQELRMVGARRENEYLMEGLGPEGVCFSAQCVF